MCKILGYGELDQTFATNGRAYNRTQYLKHRAGMMQQWADYLDKLATGGDVIQCKTA